MLAHRLQRVQIDLHTHRCWLSTFIRQTRKYHRLESYAPLLFPRNGLRRTFPSRDGVQDAVPGALAFKSNKVQAKKAILHMRLDIQGQRDVEAFQAALNDGDWSDVVRTYRGLGDKGRLTPRHTSQIAQRLHQALRKSKWAHGPDERNDTASKIVEFSEELVEGLKTGKLLPNRRGHVHLLGIFKESGAKEAGVSFWKWLEGQDERFVDADVYGAAIELVAGHGTPLAELEEMYQQALGRFPSTFASYHLSPEAVLEDRDKQTTLQRMPMTLLQGILTARLLNGDTRNSYLALDTALRLYPDQLPARFFTLFSEERPVIEAYTVFAIAWRAGISIPMGHVKYQLSALRSISDGVSAKRHPMAIRAMLSVLYMHAGVRGAITNNSITEVIIALTQLLRMDAITSLEAKDKQRLVTVVMNLIRKCIATFTPFDAWPGLAAFNSIIVNLGGYGHSKQTIGIALADAQSLGIEPNEVTRRSILIAAGLLDDTDLINKAWAEIVEARTAAGESPDAVDLHCLVKAAHLTGQIDFAREEFGKHGESLPEHDREVISDGLDDGNMYNLGVQESQQDFQLSELLKSIEKIDADLDVIGQHTKEPGKLHDYSEQALPMRMLAEDEVSLPESDLRRIYDELTTEQPTIQASSGSEESTTDSDDESSSSSPSSSPPALTPTNISFSKIRYENWKVINWLLEQSEMNDKAYASAVDKAIAAGTAPPTRSKGLAPSLAWQDVESIGLSDMVDPVRKMGKERPAKEEDVRMAKEHILRLRGQAM